MSPVACHVWPSGYRGVRYFVNYIIAQIRSNKDSGKDCGFIGPDGRTVQRVSRFLSSQGNPTQLTNDFAEALFDLGSGLDREVEFDR